MPRDVRRAPERKPPRYPIPLNIQKVSLPAAVVQSLPGCIWNVVGWGIKQGVVAGCSSSRGRGW